MLLLMCLVATVVKNHCQLSLAVCLCCLGQPPGWENLRFVDLVAGSFSDERHCRRFYEMSLSDSLLFFPLLFLFAFEFGALAVFSVVN